MAAVLPFPAGPAQRAARALLRHWAAIVRRNRANLTRLAVGAPPLPPLEMPMPLPMTTPRPAAPPPVLTPAEVSAVGAWLRRHGFGANRPRLESTLATLAALDVADAQARERLRATGSVEVLREEAREVGAAYAAGSASPAAVADAVRRLREAEAAQAEAVAALAEIERQRAAAGAILAQEARAAVREPAGATRARLRAAVARVVEAVEAAVAANEALAHEVAAASPVFDCAETSWYPGIGSGAGKLGLPRSHVREAERVIRADLRDAPQGHIGGGGPTAEWRREAAAVLARLDREA